MKRRPASTGVQAPERLLQLTVDDWMPGDPSGAFAAWCQARKEWAAEHGWPGGELAIRQEQLPAAISLPDEPWRW